VPTVSGFRNRVVWEEHFEDHKEEFGFTTKEDYLIAAIAFFGADFVDNPNILECLRPSNNDTIRYNCVTDEFGVCTMQGIIRTYCKADIDIHGFLTNLDYFHDQCAHA
jgi:pyocin large subunit-like protein